MPTNKDRTHAEAVAADPPLDNRIEPRAFVVGIWLFAYMGTCLAGGVFGMLFEGVAGFLFGMGFAAGFGIAVHVSAAIATWCLFLSRYSFQSAILGGAITGLWATWTTHEDIFMLWTYAEIAMAGFLGALGAGVSAAWFFRRTKPRCLDRLTGRFTLREMFFRTAVLSALLACWVVGPKIIRTL
ncbi:MAG: hypothetical protein KDA42_09930 [Planctomycetales bacterium]|nr:hypothetical protein [Planctomycetales bacterium]